MTSGLAVAWSYANAFTQWLFSMQGIYETGFHFFRALNWMVFFFESERYCTPHRRDVCFRNPLDTWYAAVYANKQLNIAHLILFHATLVVEGER
jgi:hypothetical protein